MSDLLIQAIGFAGVALFLISYQVKSNRLLFVMQTLGCLVFCLQFALLGAFSGCCSLLINITRNLLLTQYNKKEWVRKKIWAFLLSALGFAVSLATWAGPISILPIIATVASTMAYWTNNAKTIRLSMLCAGSPAFLLYDALVGSWGGVLNEAITLVSIIVSILRFGWKALDSDNWQ